MRTQSSAQAAARPEKRTRHRQATSPRAQLPLTLQWHCPLVLLQSGSKPLLTSQLHGPQLGFPHQPFGHCWSILGTETSSLLHRPYLPGLLPAAPRVAPRCRTAGMGEQHRARHRRPRPCCAPCISPVLAVLPEKVPCTLAHVAQGRARLAATHGLVLAGVEVTGIHAVPSVIP